MVFPVPFLRIAREAMSVYDAAIIGGGPAGCAAAILLARAGRSVVLAEKETGPHDKVCGEFISWEAAHYLCHLGVDFLAFGARAITHGRVINGNHVLEFSLPFTGWSLSRRVLDEALLQKAEEENVKVMRGMRATHLMMNNDVWNITTAQKGNIKSLSVFHASGKHDLRGFGRLHDKKPDYIGFKMHFILTPHQQDLLRNHIEIFLFDGGYAGLEPIERGRANLCFLIEKSLYEGCGKNWPGLYLWLTGKSSHLKKRLSGAAPLWPRPLSVYGIPYGYLSRQEPGLPGLFRLGDQMAVIPSFAGDGIAMALHSAFLATQTSLSGQNSDTYHQQARRDLYKPLHTAQMIATLTSHKAGRRLAFLLCRLKPDLMNKVIHGIRLTVPQIEDTETRNDPPVQPSIFHNTGNI